MKNTNSVRGYVSLAVLAAVMVLSSGQSASAGVNFDRGVDVGSFIKEAAIFDAKAPEAKSAFPVDITRDCKKVTFTQADPLASAQVPLLSRETGQDCINYGYPVGQICTPTFRDYKATAQIVVTAPRELKPGQKEVFEVCLWGSFLDMKPVSTVYKYSVNRVFDVFQLTPQGAVLPARGNMAAGARKADECGGYYNQSTCNFFGCSWVDGFAGSSGYCEEKQSNCDWYYTQNSCESAGCDWYEDFYERGCRSN